MNRTAFTIAAAIGIASLSACGGAEEAEEVETEEVGEMDDGVAPVATTEEDAVGLSEEGGALTEGEVGGVEED